MKSILYEHQLVDKDSSSYQLVGSVFILVMKQAVTGSPMPSTWYFLLLFWKDVGIVSGIGSAVAFTLGKSSGTAFFNVATRLFYWGGGVSKGESEGCAYRRRKGNTSLENRPTNRAQQWVRFPSRQRVSFWLRRGPERYRGADRHIGLICNGADPMKGIWSVCIYSVVLCCVLEYLVLKGESEGRDENIQL